MDERREAVAAIIADPDATVPVLIEPGDLVLFSAAHLHRSVSDNSLLPKIYSRILVDCFVAACCSRFLLTSALLMTSLYLKAVNTTEMCRFSTETRTVSRPDFAAGLGAPDVDGNGGAPRASWFKGVVDGAPLKQ